MTQSIQGYEFSPPYLFDLNYLQGEIDIFPSISPKVLVQQGRWIHFPSQDPSVQDPKVHQFGPCLNLIYPLCFCFSQSFLGSLLSRAPTDLHDLGSDPIRPTGYLNGITTQPLGQSTPNASIMSIY